MPSCRSVLSPASVLPTPACTSLYCAGFKGGGMAAAASLSPPPPLRCPWTKAKRAVHCGCASTRFLSSCADSFGSQPILANVPPCLSTSAAAAAVAAKEEEEEASKEEEEADSAPPPTKAKLCARSFSAVPNTVTVTSIAQAFLCFLWVFFLFFLLFPVASVAGPGFRWGGELGGVAAAPGVAALSVFLGDGTGTFFFRRWHRHVFFRRRPHCSCSGRRLQRRRDGSGWRGCAPSGGYRRRVGGPSRKLGRKWCRSCLSKFESGGCSQ